jgi:hydroxymethylbilane synthase
VTTDAVRIGSRGSDLALWQARWAQNELKKRFPDLNVNIVVIKTTGDKILDSPLSTIGDKGLFTKEIEQALLDNQIDIAVHSLKDLPTVLPDGLTIGAISEREDVRDVFIPHPLNARKQLLDQELHAKIATGSLRRTCQLLNLRPDLEIIDVRGNLNTRMKKLEESPWAGMILARAGVVRLGWQEKIGETLAESVLLPAVGQGALGIEVRGDDKAILDLVSGLNHEQTALATRAERSLLRRLEGGCQIPIGALGRVAQQGERQLLVLNGLVGSLDGRTVLHDQVTGSPTDAKQLGVELAGRLLAKGAGVILKSIRDAAAAAQTRRVDWERKM